ncbi:hypothetical protein CHS0354_009585 [Potamilus streckersoni]|uniref:Uncharacterized protein n=1 Tax=Potamilus streckersoni TaxID=2493646 RepID=A0AAE0VZJ3_9BIVA|nr:hypothetical protein CHS0354_009585 [Potamilus streckersoni]
MVDTTNPIAASANNHQKQPLPNRHHYLTNFQEYDEITKSQKGKHPLEDTDRIKRTTTAKTSSSVRQLSSDDNNTFGERLTQTQQHIYTQLTNKTKKYSCNPINSSEHSLQQENNNLTEKEMTKKNQKRIYHPAYRTRYFNKQNNSAHKINIKALS